MYNTVYINNIPFLLKFVSTSQELEKGLMYVKHLPELSGMVFIFKENGIKNMWMRNTYIPLDMLFVNDKFEIVHTHKCAKPFDLTQINSKYKCKYVIEVNCGILDKYNINSGDKIYF